MNSAKWVARQGDVYFFQIENLPKEAQEKVKQGILALGEGHGHAHMVTTPGVEVLKSLAKGCEGLSFFKSDREITVKHGRDPEFTGTELDQDYHHEVVLPPGNYMAGIVEEVDHIAKVSRKVVD